MALLSIASAGVWLTFYIGRINIGQGAFALVGGYVSAILVSTYGLSFWLSLPLAGLFCAAASILVGLPILQIARRLFRHGDAGADRSGAALRARALCHQRCQRHHQHPCARSDQPLRPDDRAGVRHFRRAQRRFLFFVGHDDGAVLRGTLATRQLADRPTVRGAETERGPGLLDGAQRRRRSAYSLMRSRRFSAAVGGAIFVAIAQSIYPSSFTVNDSVNFMLNCFLGGLGYVFGPMLGTLVLYFGWDLLFQTGAVSAPDLLDCDDPPHAPPAERALQPAPAFAARELERWRRSCKSRT